MDERVAMVENGHSQLSVRRQCQLLSLQRSCLYYQPKGESALNQELMDLIDRQFTRTPFYGVPRMVNFINTHSVHHVNTKRIERLYKVMDIRAIGPNPCTSNADKAAYKYPYLLRGLAITKPNQVWAADITYIGMQYGFLYLFAIIDLYSRMIVNWSLSNTMTAQWCCQTIQEAFRQQGTPEIFNTDQGTQFTAEQYIELLQANGVAISMDGKGRAIDNIFIERFWRSIKQECVYLHPSNTGKQLYEEIEEYMRFYNHQRGHQSLNYRIPAEVFYGNKVPFIHTKYLAVLV